VIWTTTPWTLPGNRAISFAHRIPYGAYRVTGSPDGNWSKVGATYILAKALAESVFAAAKVESFELVRDVSADELAALIVAHPLAERGYDFVVPLLDGDHVTDDTGTGFVHTAPGHGREDFDIWMASGQALTKRGIETRIPYTVDENGALTAEAPGFEGKRVFNDKGEKGDANDAVIKALIEAGALVARGRLKHQYPHSWRSKKPILFRNTPQWFIAMDKPIAGGASLRELAMKAIGVTRWVPCSSARASTRRSSTNASTRASPRPSSRRAPTPGMRKARRRASSRPNTIPPTSTKSTTCSTSGSIPARRIPMCSKTRSISRASRESIARSTAASTR
jgi:isoleucyl-tRNA synthetase